MLGFAKKLFGSSNERKVKTLATRVARSTPMKPNTALSDEALKGKTAEFKARLEKGETLDDILNEAFAVVREASKRVLGMRHFDVQMVGGMVLHFSGISEMRTGEGKTLVATLPTYLNALEGKGVHVITVNDYLARRDADWMGQVYNFLGLSYGVIVNGLSQGERQRAYRSDITYGTNNEFGFDYLRDNLVYSVDEMVQRGHNFAIVDEVDSILIDEARTPLIISGPTEDRSSFYKTIDVLVKELILDKSMFDHDEKQKQVILTEDGQEKIEEILMSAANLAEDSAGLYRRANVSVVHHVNQALRANILITRDKDYIVKGGEVVLIDEFTGRMMTGRRLSEGLHQAIEAKEGADIQPENQTLASVTIQNYFRLYKKLSGMTGTASTEAQEFDDIYKMSVSEIPTNRTIQRIDDDDEVYRTEREKNEAILKQIADCHVRGQPILVGTVSIEKSEELSKLLSTFSFEKDGKKVKGIPHQVLNARFHEQEAVIVADAGVPGAVTIATNMAGRGTDIQLGGSIDIALFNWRHEQRGMGLEITVEDEAEERARLETEIADKKAQALAAGGLFVLGTERHESRRIDNQLRGRTGRQGDRSSKFFLSCEDDLLRIFAGERLDAIMRTFGVQEGEAITHKWLNNAIATAQKRVEQRNYEIRKNLLKYDDVVNDQRKAVFEQRQEFMESSDLSDIIHEMRRDVIDDLVLRHLPPKAYAEQWDVEGLTERVKSILGLDLPIAEWAAEEGIADEEMKERITKAADEYAAQREVIITPEQMRSVEKSFLLQMIDLQWREHLMHLDHLRNVIGLRGYGQRDPLNEYKTEAFSLFEKLLGDLRTNTTRWLMTVEIAYAEPEVPHTPLDNLVEVHLDPLTGENAAFAGGIPEGLSTAQREALPVSALPEGWDRTNRNAPCPCGSGKKFKQCHGSLVR
nr:secretory component [Caulobacter vibrioides NA1000]